MKKVLLVNTNIEIYPYPIPPLGLCIIESYLEPYYEVKVYDGVFDQGNKFLRLVKDFQPDYVGFGIRNIDDVVADRNIFYIDRILSDFIRPVQAISNITLILGGSGFSIFPDELMQLSHADYGIMGEGGESLLELLRCLDNNKPVEDIPNLFIKNGAINKSNCSGNYKKHFLQPYSNLDLKIDFEPYRSIGVYSIQTKRGCIQKCIYCTYPCIEGNSLRLRDPEDVVSEITEVVRRLGSVVIEFVDSTFNEPPGYAESLCRKIIEKKLKLRLRTMGINPKNTSAELFELMIEAGFAQIDVTPDSGSPLMLKSLGKGFSLEDVQRTSNLIKKYDMPSMWFFLFGAPGENVRTINETLHFIDTSINENDLVYLTAGLRVYPRTPLYTIALREGLVKKAESILYPPLFYYSSELEKEKLNLLIIEASRIRINCIPALETQPSPEMLQEAHKLRKDSNLIEPMFRTLLRIRKQRRIEGR